MKKTGSTYEKEGTTGTQRYVLIGLSVIFVAVVVSLAFARPALSKETTEKISPGLAQVIEGAKKEGTLSLKLISTLTPKSVDRLRKEIKKRFDVDLDMKFAPIGSMPRTMAQAFAEHKAGATPSYDLLYFSTSRVAECLKAGVVEAVDWKPLITADTNPKAVMERPLLRGSLVYYTAHTGLMYNSKKVSADQVPRTHSDMADPKWRGKVGIAQSAGHWSNVAFLTSKEKVISKLQAILKNKAIQGRYPDLYNRFLIEEIWFSYTLSSFMAAAQKKGLQVGWQSVVPSTSNAYCTIVRTGALHPNA
ncbi:extracellular solute-binding protein, partial [Thermodesulfobacteriota bacterium]